MAYHNVPYKKVISIFMGKENDPTPAYDRYEKPKL